jgi:hypothetical protein
MSEPLDSLQQRIRSLAHKIVALRICCAALTIALFLSATRRVVNATAAPDTPTVKRLSILDAKGTDRVVMAALPDPIIQGKHVSRDGPFLES